MRRGKRNFFDVVSRLLSLRGVFCLLVVLLFVSILVFRVWCPVQHVSVKGVVSEGDRVEIEHYLSGFVGKSMLRVDLGQLNNVLAQHHWLQVVSLKKHWPGQIIVTGKVKEPLFLWKKDWVIDRGGSVFKARSYQATNRLLHLYADDKMTFAMVYRIYQMVALMIQDKVHGRVASLGYDAVQGWCAVVEGGAVFRLGHTQVLQRLSRLISHWGEIAHSNVCAEVYDLRYLHGVAVHCASGVVVGEKTFNAAS
jgi:cell division protein FtsQ